MNPILPLEHFVPDGEAREMPDGRLYLYGSYDLSGFRGSVPGERGMETKEAVFE